VLSNEPAARIDLPAIPGITLPSQMPLSERNYATHALQATLPVYTGGRIARRWPPPSRRRRQRLRAHPQRAGRQARRGRGLPERAARPRPCRRRTPPGRPRRPRRRRGRTGQAGLVARNDILSVAVARADATSASPRPATPPSSPPPPTTACCAARSMRRWTSPNRPRRHPPGDIAALAGRARSLRPNWPCSAPRPSHRPRSRPGRAGCGPRSAVGRRGA
jgi:hypothetical protein